MLTTMRSVHLKHAQTMFLIGKLCKKVIEFQENKNRIAIKCNWYNNLIKNAKEPWLIRNVRQGERNKLWKASPKCCVYITSSKEACK